MLIVPAKRMWPAGGSIAPSGTYAITGATSALPRLAAMRAASARARTLCLPSAMCGPLCSVPPTGTISIPESAFEATLEGAARSFRQAGFRDIVLIGDHGGYQASLVKVAARLDREWAKQASPVRVHAIEEYYRAAERDFAQALRQQGFSEAEIGTHAGAADTSLSLAVDEQLVRASLLHDGSALGPANGVHGDPRRASAAAGKAGIDLIVARTRDAIQREVARR